MNIRVLVADDHAVVRDGLRALLDLQKDISVIGDATDGRQAVSEAERLRPDVVVMDITMPELNGIEATERICKAHPGVRVLMLSMHASTEYIYRALQAGAQGYLLKESAAVEVVDAVRALYAGRRYFSHKISDMLVDDYVREHRPVSPLESLSLREREILQLIVEGKTNAEVAAQLSLSVKTVETYRSRLMHKLRIGDLPALVKFAIQHGITPLE
jgi:DNA-binding NarL/FixJ family response regulator